MTNQKPPILHSTSLEPQPHHPVWRIYESWIDPGHLEPIQFNSIASVTMQVVSRCFTETQSLTQHDPTNIGIWNISAIEILPINTGKDVSRWRLCIDVCSVDHSENPVLSALGAELVMFSFSWSLSTKSDPAQRRLPRGQLLDLNLKRLTGVIIMGQRNRGGL